MKRATRQAGHPTFGVAFFRRVLVLPLVPLLVLMLVPAWALGQTPPPQSGDQAQSDYQAWPREYKSGGTTITVYQPQIEKWKSRDMSGRAAVSVKGDSSPQEHFGVIWFTAKTNINRSENLVSLDEITITKGNFPATPEEADQYLKVLRDSVPQHLENLSLKHLEGQLAVSKAESAPQKPVAVKNEAPKIYFSDQPAMLVQIDGKPVLRQVQGSDLVRVINTYAVILLNRSQGVYYLRAVGRWFQARSLEGPWSQTKNPPADFNKILADLSKGGQINTLDKPGAYVEKSLNQGVLPRIYVSTVPAELIMTEGKPSYQPIADTSLLEVVNTEANIIVDPAHSLSYVLISGRWFQSKSAQSGPWSYVPNDKLPADFAKIPENHPRGVVLASVSGTPPAQEAIIDNSIPETAVVDRSTANFNVDYGGSPQLKGISGTPLQYVVNSPYPVIRVDAHSWYALKDGVWFVGTAVTGPWVVADSVPAVIYTIPASSPLYNVTYVYVYSATPQTVVVGYTPGYYGTVLAPTGTVVYGTGYVYPPVYYGAYWYPRPVTYGYGAGFFWGSVTGFAFGAAAGAIWGGAWGHWGGWGGHNNVTINNYNSYNRWNSNQVRSNVNRNVNRNVQRDVNRQAGNFNRSNLDKRGGQMSPQQRQQAKSNLDKRGGQMSPQQRQQAKSNLDKRGSQMSPQQRQQAKGNLDKHSGQLSQQQRGNIQDRSGKRPNDVYAGKDGKAYKRNTSGNWQEHGSGGWNNAGFKGGGESREGLNRQQQARSYGNRTNNMQHSFGGGGGGGKFGGGGGGGRGGGGFHGGGRR